MKIVIATGLYPPEIGGPATHTVLMEKEMSKRGHEVIVVPFSKSRHLPKIIRHIHYTYLVSRKAIKADVVFAQDVASVGLPALFASRLARKKFFVRVPGDYAWEQSVQRFGVKENIDDFQKKTYKGMVKFLQSVQKRVTKSADAVITPSEYFRNLVIAWGVKPENVHTIYNGVDLNIEPVKVTKPAPLTIVTAGRLVAWKGIDVLIKMMVDLPVWHLVILGDGPEKESLQKMVSDLHLESRVHFKGVVSREEVFGWCSVADAFVLNTRFESFSYQIVEALYSGVPVITTNIGSLPEIIESGEEGLLVDCDDEEKITEAIKSVVVDKSSWQHRVIEGKKKAEQFSIEKTIEKLDELLLKKVK